MQLTPIVLRPNIVGAVCINPFLFPAHSHDNWTTCTLRGRPPFWPALGLTQYNGNTATNILQTAPSKT